MVASLTTPFRAAHPDVSFTVLSCNSIAILGMLENLEIDAGLTYLDNEPVGRVRTVPLYREHYRLLTAPDHPLGNRERVSWAEVAQVPLCLLTPDMQNRRIIDRHIRAAGAEPAPTLESNSMILLFSHVRTGRWGERHAGTTGRNTGAHRDHPGDPDQRRRALSDDRTGRATP
jgi:DNA-binding transcriptional LysR family regulator